MKKIYTISILLFLMIITDSCIVKKDSSGQKLFRILHDPAMSYTSLEEQVKDSKNTATAFSDENADISLSNKLLKFNEGCYMVRIMEDEVTLLPQKDTIKVYPHKNDSEITIVPRRNKSRPDSIYATTHKINNLLPKDSSDKIIYLIFLDDNRVLYHSPYRNKKIKSGNDSIDISKFKYNPGHPKSFVRETEVFFKLGYDYEFNSVQRGYYKINNKHGLSIWLETYIEKEKIVLTRLNFRYTIKNNQVESIRFRSSYFRDSFVSIDDTFENFGKGGVEFKFYPNQFKLLLLKDKNLHIISKIDQSGDTRTYQSINSYDCSKGCIKINQEILNEKVSSPETF